MDGVQPAELARCLFNESNDAFLIVEPTDRSLLTVNATAQRLTGWRKSKLLSMTLDELLESADPKDSLKLRHACESTSFFHSQEGYCLCRNDATPLAVNVSVSRIHGESKTFALVVLRDVSKRKLVEEELREANSCLEKALRELAQSQAEMIQRERLGVIGQMSSGLAHELNNLLSPVVSYTELLLAQKQLPEKAIEQLSLISTAANDAVNVVKQLQMFNRRDDELMSSEDLDLAELVQQIHELTRPKWWNETIRTGREITFELQLEDVSLVHGNPSELRQVFTNLVFNAVDAMPSGGCISLRLHSREDSVVVEIADTGMGMTDDQRNRSLEPFYTTKEHGSGLGLSICNGIVKRHGGQLEIDSEIGHGTTVRVSLPISNIRCIQSSPEADDPVSLKNMRILYIDDDRNVLESFDALLSSMGMQVDLAEDGPSGVGMLKHNSYDLVVTDLGMVGMNGREVTRIVKELCPETPVIVISGWDEAKVLEGFQETLKPDAIIAKPATISSLHDAIKRLKLNKTGKFAQ